MSESSGSSTSSSNHADDVIDVEEVLESDDEVVQPPLGPEDYEERLNVLEQLYEVMQTSDLFDDDDINAMLHEIERVQKKKQEKEDFERRCQERLRILSRYDAILNMKENHPKLNKFFIKKQQKMQMMVDKIKDSARR